MAETRAEQVVDKKSNEGFLTRRVRFVIDVIAWIAMALVLSILIEWLGIFFGWWQQPGSFHSETILQKELTWLNKDFSNVLGSPAHSSVRFSRYMYEMLFIWFGIDTAKSLLTVSSLAPVEAYFKASFTIIQLFFVRIVILAFSFPVFLVFAIVTIIDGAVMRDIRRFGLDLERAYIWHHAKAAIKPLVVTPFIVYLGSPWSIHPNWIILPFVLALSIALWLVTSKFKKHA